MVTAAMKSEDTFFLVGKLRMTNSVLKSRDITLLTKIHIIKAMVFPVVTYSCEPLYSIVWEMITDTIVGCSLGIGTNNMPSFHAAILSSTRTEEDAKKVLMDFKKYIEKWVSIYEDNLRNAAESTKQIPQFIDGDTLQSLINMTMNASTAHSNINES